jgi:hypothetical protein
MVNITIPYGYSTFLVGNVAVYTGKLRIKQDLTDVWEYINGLPNNSSITAYEGKNRCTIIRWSTTDAMQAADYGKAMRSYMAGIMHKRIAWKYGELVEAEPDFGW